MSQSCTAAAAVTMGLITLSALVTAVEGDDLPRAIEVLKMMARAEDGDGGLEQVAAAISVTRLAHALASVAEAAGALGEREAAALLAIIENQKQLVGRLLAAASASANVRN